MSPLFAPTVWSERVTGERWRAKESGRGSKNQLALRYLINLRPDMRLLGFAISLLFCIGCSPTIPSWSVAVFPSEKLLSFDVPTSATLSREDLCDGKPCDLADPFILRKDDRWYLFFEHIPPETHVGKIAVATSSDARHWSYEGIVLDEPFHLSFPYVFEHKGRMYMIPESRQGGGIILYKASEFPKGWKRERMLIEGDYADPTIAFYNGRWWIFAVRSAYSLAIFFSDSLEGPWREHPMSPMYAHDKGKTRPGGRLLVTKGGLIRFAQDNREGYGSKLRAFAITKLSRAKFEEKEIEKSPFLEAGGDGWRAKGMHQFDAFPFSDKREQGYMIAVDGFGFPENNE